jgi:tripartite-type tricarboxylate transporter receptor subunit TctC
MTMKTTFAAALAALAALATLVPPGASAQSDDWPSRPISLVVTFGPGSGSEMVARHYARALKEKLNANAVVEFKPGAAGAIGAQAVARAAPDGYTVLVGSGTVNAANYPLFRGQLKYGPQDFVTVATTFVTPPVLIAARHLPGDSVPDLLARAKREGRKLSCGSGNAVTQVACEWLRRKTGADLVNVPYKGNGQSLTDLAAGQIDLAFSDLGAANPFLARDGVRPIAVPMAARLSALPEVRTFAEQGIADFEFLSWNTFFVPVGTPPAVIRRLNDAAKHMLGTAEWEKQRIATSGAKVSGDLAESDAFVKAEIARWERYVAETGVKGTQ